VYKFSSSGGQDSLGTDGDLVPPTPDRVAASHQFRSNTASQGGSLETTATSTESAFFSQVDGDSLLA
jgi:hypothetical protein